MLPRKSSSLPGSRPSAINWRAVAQQLSEMSSRISRTSLCCRGLPYSPAVRTGNSGRSRCAPQAAVAGDISLPCTINIQPVEIMASIGSISA